MKIADFYQYSWFADIAYVEWDDLNSVDSSAWIQAAHAAERIPGKSGGAGDTTADTLGENIFYPTVRGGLGWQLLAFHTNEDSDSGFAASLYDDGNEKVLAIRGTEANFSGGPDDLANADMRDIVRLGVAVEQAISLVNWVRLLSADEGADVEQIAEPSDTALLAIAVTPISAIAGGALGVLLDSLERTTLVGGGLGQLGAADQVTVTGHSLGGHMALLSARLFPNLIDQAVTFNAPGFDTPFGHGLTETLVDWLRDAGIAPAAASFGSFGSLALNNLQAESSGPDVFAGDADIIGDLGTLPQGEQIVNVEVSTHSMDQFMQDLGVHALLERLLENTGSPATLADTNGLFAAFSNQEGNTTEIFLDGLFRLFLPAEFETQGALPVSAGSGYIGGPAFDTRTAFTERLIAIEQALKDIPNTGLTTVDSLADSATADTPEGLAYRYALVELNPFAVVGLDQATSDALYDTAHNPGGELDWYDPATGQGTLTDDYMTQRGKMLSLKDRLFAEDKTSTRMALDE